MKTSSCSRCSASPLGLIATISTPGATATVTLCMSCYHAWTDHLGKATARILATFLDQPRDDHEQRDDLADR